MSPNNLSSPTPKHRRLLESLAGREIGMDVRVNSHAAEFCQDLGWFESNMKHLMTEEERKLASRRQAIEPIIGHLKSDHRLDRCHLKGKTGDAIHAVLCAAGYNIKWLMRMILQKAIKPFLFLFFLPKNYTPNLRI